MSPPTRRLAAGSFYKEMPPDSHHIYIRLPIDHGNPELGSFTGFYLLSPNFKPGGKIIFQLYDNQQEMVGMIASSADFEAFDERVGKEMSYVLIGNRGVSPTLFPEVFKKDGSVDYKKALKLYGSDEQIEDIETVRLDMENRGLLPSDGKIMLYGGSGGGVLIQQFLNKYGNHVSRVLIESTGAPDIARKNGHPFIKTLYNSNPTAAQLYFKLYKEGNTSASLAWMIFKIGLEGNTELQTEVLEGKQHFFNLSGRFIYLKNWLKLSQNFQIVNLFMSFPVELEVKVRMWEVAGSDLINYNPKTEMEIIPLYESLKYLLADLLNSNYKGEIATILINPDRSQFQGEVLIFANEGDQDFGPDIARLISSAYPHSRLAVFNENAHHILKKDRFQLRFTRAFFESGLYSDSVRKYFDDKWLINR
jgi:pimeloyl-ACP methyl ester carboxylesterase